MVDIQKMMADGRQLGPAVENDPDLGPFKQLAGGIWTTEKRGWNMIALPAQKTNDYRLLLNRYSEKLIFINADKAVSNRGLDRETRKTKDQILVALDYEQTTTQIKVEDKPKTEHMPPVIKKIHHEPGLFLFLLNHETDDLKIARLATIPHGNSVLALGRVNTKDGPPEIPLINGLPEGVNGDEEYLAPYRHFQANLFDKDFDPVNPNALLRKTNAKLNIIRHTEFHFDTRFETGGIVNIPFIETQADAVEMQSSFWLSEIKTGAGEIELQLQYSQNVILEFGKRLDGKSGKIRWPHVSISTLRKEDLPIEKEKMPLRAANGQL